MPSCLKHLLFKPIGQLELVMGFKISRIRLKFRLRTSEDNTDLCPLPIRLRTDCKISQTLYETSLDIYMPLIFLFRGNIRYNIRIDIIHGTLGLSRIDFVKYVRQEPLRIFDFLEM